MHIYGCWAMDQKRKSCRRIWSLENLPMPRAFMTGPKWRKHFEVREVRAGDYPNDFKYHHPLRKFLVFSFEEDIRERLLEEIRPGVVAQWSDPRERIAQ